MSLSLNAEDQSLCSSCGASFRSNAGYVRCPQCGNPLNGSDGTPKSSIAGTMHGLFKRYEGHSIGINYDDPITVKIATLTKANTDYFSVRANGLLMHFPYRYVLNIAESKSGVKTGDFLTHSVFELVVQVYHKVVYKGAIGIEIPLSF